MGRSKMSSLKITLLPLAICLLLSLNSQVSGKPSPKHYLIETKEKAKKSSDYVKDITNHGVVHKVIDGSTNFDYVNNVNNDGVVGSIHDHSFNDYVNNIKNNGKVGVIKDKSLNFKDYMNIGTANNHGSIVENNNNYNHPYWGKK